MTQALMGSRKRLRSNNCEEECCDFMPLSKRINNLHINNGNYFTVLGHTHSKLDLSKQNGMYEPNPEQWNSVAAVGENLNVDESVNYLISEQECHSQAGRSLITNPGGHIWMSEQILCHYSPSLSASDNPHYYENNKLLFALYMERLQRTGEALY